MEHENAELSDFADSTWEVVNLPHGLELISPMASGAVHVPTKMPSALRIDHVVRLLRTIVFSLDDSPSYAHVANSTAPDAAPPRPPQGADRIFVLERSPFGHDGPVPRLRGHVASP